jgi:hypothetical protein
MPKTIEEMEKELILAVWATRRDLSIRKGYSQHDLRDAISETMKRLPELFDQFREATIPTGDKEGMPPRFEDNFDIAVWLEQKMAKLAKTGDANATAG